MSWAGLAPLIGEWEGHGRVFYPTIPTIEFRDHIVVSEAGSSLYHYLQRTWKLTLEGEVGSHRETGFIFADGAGAVQMLGAHGGDRVEVLAGQAERVGDRLRLELHSVVVAHDPRVLRSWRTITVAGETMSYTMGMATTSVPDGEEHLVATLTRIGRGG
jgi:hypothetical protein